MCNIMEMLSNQPEMSQVTPHYRQSRASTPHAQERSNARTVTKKNKEEEKSATPHPIQLVFIIALTKQQMDFTQKGGHSSHRTVDRLHTEFDHVA
jgi:hypothetical protein